MTALDEVIDLFAGLLKVCVREKNPHAPEGGYKHWDLPSDGNFLARVDGQYDRIVIMLNGEPVMRYWPLDLPCYLCSGDTLLVEPEAVAQLVYRLIDQGALVK